MKKRVLIVAMVLVVAMLMTTALLSANSNVQLHLIERQGAGGGGCLASGTTTGGSVPDNTPTGVCWDIAVSGAPAGATVTGISMTIAANHSWVGDLHFWLNSPDGSQLTLYHRPGVDGPAGSGFGSSADLSSSFPLDFYDAAPTDGEQIGAGLSGTQIVCQANGICDFNPGPDGQPGLSDFAGFNGEAVSNTWSLCASDNAAGDTGAATGATLNITCQAPVSFAIAMTKTVGLDPNVCATTDSIEIPAGYGGTEVTYCYYMTNQSTTTVTHHTVNDDQLGTVLGPGFPANVGPGSSAVFTVTTLITQTTVNSATWLVYAGSPTTPPVASASDTATVTRGQPTDVNLSSFGSQSAALSPVWVAATLVLVVSLGLALRRKFNSA
jgi:hypothetical protein